MNLTKNLNLIAFGAIALFLFMYLKSCDERSKLEEELAIRDNNLIALKDSLRVEKTKNGELQYIKTAFIADIKALKELNKDLYNEVKSQKSEVYYISKITAEIKDRIKGLTPGGDHKYDPVSGNDNISWEFDTTGTNWGRTIEGVTSFKVTSTCNGYKIEPKGSQLKDVKYKFSLVTGIKESEINKGSLEIFINSTYPGMTFTDIQGSVVNPEELKKYLPSPKPHKWSVGPYVGVGYGVTLQQTPMFFPVFNVGIGLQYKIFSF